ncbi:MAG: hemolysin family protein [Actinomycetaceae bacterium]|nr:hemolysin family protein [Actinomycetaceae bacterium]
MSLSTGLFLTVLLLAVNAFFVASEFAVTSSRRPQIMPLAEQGSARAKDALWALEHVSLMLAVCQLGITLASTALGTVAEPALAQLVLPLVRVLGLPAEVAHGVAVAVALVIVLYLHVVAGEMVPKNLTVSAPTKMVLALAPILVRIGRVCKPVVEAMDHFANRLLRLVGVEPKSEVVQAFTAEEVASIVELSAAEGVLSDDLGLLSGTLEFSAEQVDAVMVPTAQLVCLPAVITPADVEAAVAKTGFSRFPLRKSTADADLVGYIHVKDILYADATTRTEPVDPWRIRTLPVAKINDQVEDALRIMQKTGVHLAQVVDGERTVGVIFLEDILEELIGEIRDALQRK